MSGGRVLNIRGGIGKYILKDWIPPEKLNIKMLSSNPNNKEAIELLKSKPEKIDWDVFSANPSQYACYRFIKKKMLIK
jgi:hypothetical protein